MIEFGRRSYRSCAHRSGQRLGAVPWRRRRTGGERATAIMVMMARAPKAKRICACCGPTAANTPSDGPTVKPAAFGNNATRPAAIVIAGTSLFGASGRAAIRAVSRVAAASLGIRARLAASCHGSTSNRASAERTLSGVPFRPSPIDAPRNLSNSAPMRGASGACVMATDDSLLERENQAAREATPGLPIHRQAPTNRARRPAPSDSETTHIALSRSVES